MQISEIIANNDLPVRVWNGNENYPPFTIIEQSEKDDVWITLSDTGKRGIVSSCPWINDYEILEPFQKKERSLSNS